MGNRRVSRKRLYQIEKAGQAIDLASGAGIADAISSATQHRQGQEIITEIAIDLGTSKQDIEAPGTDRYVIGEDSKKAHITQLTVAKFGIITEVRAIVMEAPTGGSTDIAIEHAAASVDGGVDPTGTVVTNLGALTAIGQDASGPYDANNLADRFLYVCSGETGSNADMSTGKLLIYIHGFVAPADL
jgi:hypothetical protein